MFAHVRHKTQSHRGALITMALVLLLACAVMTSIALAHSRNSRDSYTPSSRFAKAAFVAESTHGVNTRAVRLADAKTSAKKPASLFPAGESTEPLSSASKPDTQTDSGDSGEPAGDGAAGQGQGVREGDGAAGQGQGVREGDGAAGQGQDAPKILSTSIKSSDGRTYTVTVTYDQKANISNGAQLKVTELNQLPSDWDDEDKQRTDYKDRPLATELLLGEDEYKQRSELLGKTLQLDKDDRVTWSKFLDVSIEADQETIAPESDVTVEIQTNAVAAASSDALEVARLDGDESVRLETTNTTGTKEDESNKKPEELEARLSIKTDKLGELAIAQVVQRKFGWRLFDKDISVYAARSVKATPHEIPLDFDYLNNSRLVSLVGIVVDPTRTYGTNLWADAAVVEGANEETDSVMVFSLNDNGESTQLIGKEGTKGLVSFGASDPLAFVWQGGASLARKTTNDKPLQAASEPEEGYAYVMAKGSSALLSDVFKANQIPDTTLDEVSAITVPEDAHLAVAQQQDGDWLIATDEGFAAPATLTISLDDEQPEGQDPATSEPMRIVIKPGFSITWNDYDDSLLKKTVSEPNEMPAYGDENPTREPDESHKYVFAGWEPEVVEATQDATYKAKYDAIQFVCKIDDNKFTTLNEAMDYAHENLSGQATISMLRDYTMPATDAVEVLPTDNITLTSEGDETYTLLRGEDLVSGQLLTNAGTLSLLKIAIDGNGEHVTAGAALINNSKTLVVGEGATLRNAKTTADGGAIYSTGTVQITGGTLSDNQANNGGGIYAAAGGVSVESGTLQNNTASANGGAIYAQGGTLDVLGGNASSNRAADGGFGYMADGVVTVQNATLQSNVASGSGGSLYVGAGSLELGDGANLAQNNAASGGALFVGSATLTIGGTAQLTNNTATQNGGAAYANSGDVLVTDTAAITGNEATGGSGGAIHAQEGDVSIGGGTLSNNTAATDGGALYAGSGVVSINAGSIINNASTGGNGGALYAATGRVTLTSATLSNNVASAGNGGAAYIGSGVLSVLGIQITQNTALNGSALFVNGGSATLSDGTSILDNVSASGGAVGVGSDSVRLTFGGNVQVSGNKLGNAESSQQSNVYLSQDKDTVINTTGLASDAQIGVYVADSVINTRGVPGATFASYTNSENYSVFKNDRTQNLTAQLGGNNKLVWGSPLNVLVYYVAKYSNNGQPQFPPVQGARVVYPRNAYYPSAATMGVSDIGAELYSNFASQYPTAGFGNAFASGATLFGEYLTQVKWNTDQNAWYYVKRDGTEIPATADLELYYTEPTFVSIENNTAYELDLSALSALGANAINTSEAAGYGYVMAKNGVTQHTLMPITANDLKLRANRSIRLMFPGAGGAAYAFTGKYEGGVSEPIRLRRTDVAEEYVSVQEATSDFTRTGTLVAKSGDTTQIIFGGDKPICKIVAPESAIGTVATGEVAGQSEPDSSGSVEYLFSTMRRAVSFVQTHATALNKTATIQMLVDYLMPGTDTVTVPAGYNLTFDTATTGEYRYESSEPNPRATISRDTTNKNSFISASTQNNDGLTLVVRNLVLDGKALVGSGDGGAINTYNCKTTIANCDIKNFTAGKGGAVYVDYKITGSNYLVTDDPSASPQDRRTTLLVTNTDFSNNKSTTTVDRFGGGAIWTCAKRLDVDGGTYESCVGSNQAGAIFHRVDGGYCPGTESVIRNCVFSNCKANAAGGLECDSENTTVEGCRFMHCEALKRGGGAINVYAHNTAEPTAACSVTITGCEFDDCHAIKGGTGNSTNGGGIRSNAKATTITSCSFNNVSAGYSGGGVSATNKNATSLQVLGCSFNEANTSRTGGAIYCMAKELVVGDATADGTAVHTTITKSSATSSGGGIYHPVSSAGSSTTITNAIITGCTTSSTGAGVYSNALSLTIEGGEIYGNTSTGDGAGVWYESSSRKSMALTLKGAYIHNNSSGGHGGGIYTRAANLKAEALPAGSGQLRTRIADNVAAKQGGGIGYFNYNDSGVTSNVELDACDITGNRANGKSDTNASGGGLYSNSGKLKITDCNIRNNTAAGSGGGICCDNNGGTFELIRGEVSGNTAANLGGGIWTRSDLIAQNARVTGNRLSTNDAQNAAGVYIIDSRKLKLGKEGEPGPNSTTINNNVTASGNASNLRLWETNGKNNSSSVMVYCDLTGDIRVVNAKVRGTQFGSSSIADPAGFVKDASSGQVPVFNADDGSIYGVIDRLDETRKKIIWAADPICKITDSAGTLLYFKTSDSSARYIPAVFDQLDNGTANAGLTGAFTILKNSKANLKLYYADGTRYGDDESENEFHVKMLVENYTAAQCVYTNKANDHIGSNLYPWMKIVLTTAGANDSAYPYRGAPGTRSTITRGATIPADKTLIDAHVCITFTNIVLDGGKTGGVSTTANGVLVSNTGDNNKGSQYTTIEVGQNATLQNGETSRNGGAIFADWGNVKVNGGTIQNCTAGGSGGAIYMISTYKFTGGPERGMMEILPHSVIRVNTAASGGGVYIGGGAQATMSGGEIKDNRATAKGAGIAFDANNASNCLYFLGAPIVRNNKLNGAECNVHLDRDTNDFINVGSPGLDEGAYIGVYVPDGATLYNKHGDEGKPFGKYADGARTSTFYSFANDRNGLNGGLKSGGDPNTIYWVEVYSLRVGKTLESELATDASKQFTFVVELLNDAGQPDASINKTISGVVFEGGVSRPIHLRGGMYKLLQDLPLDQRFRVSERLDASDAQAFDVAPATYIEDRIQTYPSKQGSDRYITDAAFTNTRKTGNLTVSKTVESDTDADKQESFSFRVTLAGLTEDGANSSYGGLQFTNGVSEEFTLTDGQSRTLDGLPTNATFTVEEMLPGDRQSYYTTIPVLTQNDTTLSESPLPSRSQAGTVVEGESKVEFYNRKNISFTVSKQWAESVSNKDDLEIDFELYKVKARPGNNNWGQVGPNVSTLPDALLDLDYNWEDHVEPRQNIDVGQTFKFFVYNGHYYYFQISGQQYYNENMSAEEFLNSLLRNEASAPVIEFTGRVWDLDTLKAGLASGEYNIANNNNAFWFTTDQNDTSGKVRYHVGDLIFYNNQYYILAKASNFKLFELDQNTGEYRFNPDNKIGPNNDIRGIEVGESVPGTGSSSAEVRIEYSEQATAEDLVNSLTDSEHNYEVTAVPNVADDAAPGGYYTLNADNDWSITFDDLDYRYDYYAVEWHIHPKGDRQTELRDNFVTTYDYVQGDHATIINTPAGSRKVILRKVAKVSGDNYVSLAGARFRIYNDNGTPQGSSEITVGMPDGKDYYESMDPSGVNFVGTLPYGKYKVVETAYPAGYEPAGYNAQDPTTWFYYLLTVDEDGTHIEGPKTYEGSDVVLPEATYAIVLNPEGVHDGVYFERQGEVHASLQVSTDGGKSYRAVESDVTWSTNNASTANVSSNGMLTIGSVGTATITAEATDADGNPITAYKQIEVQKTEDTSISTTRLEGIIGPNGMLSAAGVVTFTYTVNGQPAPLTGHTLTFDGYDSSLIDVSAVGGVATVTYKASGNTSINVSFDGEKLYTVTVEVAEVQLMTTSLTNKTAGTTEQNAIQVQYRVGNSDRSGEVAGHLDYEYDVAGYGVAEVLADKLSVAYKKAGTTQLGVKFDGTQIGRITVTVNAADPLTDLSYLFNNKQGTKELTIEGSTSTVDVYTWPKDAASEYLASVNGDQSESMRHLSVPAGRVFEQDGVYYYFKESVTVTLGDLSWHNLSVIRGWGLQDKILIVTPPNGESGEGGSGGSTTEPTPNSAVTAEQANGSWISGWQGSSTWHSSSDGSYMYASTDANAVSIVYSNGHYYVPLKNGNPDYLDATMLSDSFETSHLTDGAEHSYHQNGNPYWTEARTWAMTS